MSRSKPATANVDGPQLDMPIVGPRVAADTGETETLGPTGAPQRTPIPVPQALVRSAERFRRRESVTEARIREEAPTPTAAAEALLRVWRHPDKFPFLERAVTAERAFRERHPRLEAITVASSIMVPLANNPQIPAGASDIYISAALAGSIGLATCFTAATVWSMLAISRMSRRQQFPKTYPAIQRWHESDLPHPGMMQQATLLASEYVRVLSQSDLVHSRAVEQRKEAARVELRRLALITRKHAAATAAAEAYLQSGDESTTLVPLALAEDLMAEFANQCEHAKEAIARLRATAAATIAETKLRTLALPDPRCAEGTA